MSTDYFAVCFTCKCSMPGILASGSGSYGFKVWDDGLKEFRQWLEGGENAAVGAHEGHDVRIMSEHDDLPWESSE